MKGFRINGSSIFFEIALARDANSTGELNQYFSSIGNKDEIPR